VLFFLIIVGVLVVGNALTKSHEPKTTGSVSNTSPNAAAPAMPAAPSPEERRAARQRFAEEYEKKMLTKGMDFTVRATGPQRRTLDMKWILVSRPLAYQLSQDQEVVENLQQMGFRRVIIGDGHDERYSFTIDPLPGDVDPAGPVAKPIKRQWVGDTALKVVYYSTAQCHPAKVLLGEGTGRVFKTVEDAFAEGYRRSETKGCDD
jgi:hypothetical protein